MSEPIASPSTAPAPAPAPAPPAGAAPSGLDVWYTRCAVPTASGIALRNGWLADAFGRDGHRFGVLQEGPPAYDRHHFDHELVGLIREGGSVPAIAARAEGTPTRLIGLTWIDERQAIVVRPDSGVAEPADLAGLRFAIPAWSDTRAKSFFRSMALQGAAGALALAGLTLDDVTLVEVAGQPITSARRPVDRPVRMWDGLDELAAGTVDAVYVKGSLGVEEARAAGAVIAVDLDRFPDLVNRVNNGTPRPLTVHADLLRDHREVVVQFLVETLRAAAWAADDLDGVRAILAEETWSGPEGVRDAYGDQFHLGLAPDLSDERVALLGVHKDFLYRHGFLTRDFELDDWVDRGPLADAHARLAEGASPALSFV